MNYEIRLIKKSEIEQAGRIYALAFNKADVGENWTNESAAEFLKFWYKKASDIFFVALNNGDVIGGVVGEIIPYAEGKYFANGELFVDPKFQNQGIGRKLTKTIIEKSIKNYGVKYICWIANGQTEFPISWYESIGMQRTRWVLMDGEAKKILNNLNK